MKTFNSLLNKSPTHFYGPFGWLVGALAVVSILTALLRGLRLRVGVESEFYLILLLAK